MIKFYLLRVFRYVMFLIFLAKVELISFERGEFGSKLHQLLK